MGVSTAGKKVLAAFVMAAFVVARPQAGPAQEFHYDAKSVETAAYWAALSNLANAVMFSGLGKPQIISAYERDDWLRRAGYVARPRMPDIPMGGMIYAAGDPKFAGRPDIAEPRTLQWDARTFDRTLDPGAHGWTLIKITSPEFHLRFHDIPASRLAGLMMLPQARTQAAAILKQMRTAEGLFAPRGPDGALGKPRPRDQAVVLWSAANLIRAATNDHKDYWHAAYRAKTDPADTRDLLNAAFLAVTKLAPAKPGDRAIAIEALARYALVAPDSKRRRAALDLARGHAGALVEAAPATLEDLGLSIYGLIEAGRLFDGEVYRRAAARRFRENLLPLWDETLGVFRNDGPRYDTSTVGAVVAGLNAIRWHGSDADAATARRLYPRFFETIFVAAGMLRSSPLRLVAAEYRKRLPAAHFAHPRLPDPVESGVAPVFAGAVAWRKDRWAVTDPMFRGAGAMFLANMLALRGERAADPFLGDDHLRALRR